MSAATTFASMVQQMTMGMGVAAGAIALRIAALLRHDSGGQSHNSRFSSGVRVSLVALISVLDFLQLDTAAGAVVSAIRTQVSVSGRNVSAGRLLGKTVRVLLSPVPYKSMLTSSLK